MKVCQTLSIDHAHNHPVYISTLNNQLRIDIGQLVNASIASWKLLSEDHNDVFWHNSLSANCEWAY